VSEPSTPTAVPPQPPVGSGSDTATAAAANKPPRRRSHPVLRILNLLGIVYTVITLVAMLGLRWILFPTYIMPPAPPAPEFGTDVTPMPIVESTGSVEAYLFTPPKVTPDQPRPAVVIAHGNAELIDSMIPLARNLQNMGLFVLLPEYRGYGRSPGSPSQTNITADFIHLHDQLAKVPGVDPARIIFIGRSIGTGVVCSLAQHRKPAALVLISPFRSIGVMAERYLIPSWMILSNRFDNEATVAAFDGPLMVLHGRHDTLIPFSHGEHLAGLSQRATLIPLDSNHNDVPLETRHFAAEIEQFFRAHDLLK
jgi:pimeloyl-ACP methyl ester carboxylesterase